MRGTYRTLGGALSALALAAATVAPALAQASIPERGYIVGRWTDDGNCANAVSFKRDGTFTAANGAGGLWHLDGASLTLTGSSTLRMQVVPVDRNSIDVVNADGSTGHSIRCPGGESGGGETMDVTDAYIVGRWTDDGNCGSAASFLADRSFIAGNGNAGRWMLSGDRLTLTGSDTLTLQIVAIDRDTMNVVNPDGSLGRSTRC